MAGLSVIALVGVLCGLVSYAGADMDMSSYEPYCPDSGVFVNNIAGCSFCMVHGMLMFLAYGILMAGGMFTARYIKPYAEWWFPLHILLMVCAFIIATPSFVLAIDVMPGLPVPPEAGGASDEIMNCHHILGYITYSLTCLQLLLGTASHFMYNPGRKSTPWFPDRLHWGFGYLTLLSAFITIFVAVFMMNMPMDYAIVFSVYLGLVFGGIIFMEVFVYVWPSASKAHGGPSTFVGIDESEDDVDETKLTTSQKYRRTNGKGPDHDRLIVNQ